MIKFEKEMKNEKFIVELGEITEVRDAENVPTVEVNIKVNLDGIFLTEAMREAISKAFDGNQLFWHEVANIFLGDIGKAYIGFSRRLKNGKLTSTVDRASGRRKRA